MAVYLSELDEDGQVFKGKAKAFVTYSFLSSVLPYANVEVREKLSIFLNFLLPKLPAPIGKEGPRRGHPRGNDRHGPSGQQAGAYSAADADRLGPVPAAGGGPGQAGTRPAFEHHRIVQRSVRQCAVGRRGPRAPAHLKEIRSEWRRTGRTRTRARTPTGKNARIEHDKALLRVMTALMKDDAGYFGSSWTAGRSAAG
ncbi:MAG: hypothetical protein U0704_05725 [Candidatus Eisenbacteria bacterium]